MFLGFFKMAGMKTLNLFGVIAILMKQAPNLAEMAYFISLTLSLQTSKYIDSFLPASNKTLFIQHCHACLQASIAVLYAMSFVAVGRNEPAVKKKFGSERVEIILAVKGLTNLRLVLPL